MLSDGRDTVSSFDLYGLVTSRLTFEPGNCARHGVKLKFSGQPFQVLAILLEQPGDMVTREELQKRLWPDTFVDVDAISTPPSIRSAKCWGLCREPALC